MRRKLNLNVTLATDIASNIEMLDGYIFAVMIKVTFVSGRINNATQRKISAALKIGSRKCKSLLNAALKYGYVNRIGNDIVAVKVNKTGDYLQPIYTKTTRISERANGVTPICPFKYTELRRMVREAILLNHVQKQEDCVNTIVRHADPANLKEFKQTGNRIKRMCAKSIAKNTDRLSYARIAEITGTSRATAINIVKKLTKSEQLTKTVNIENTDLDIQDILKISHNDSSFRKMCNYWLREYAKNLDSGFPTLTWRWLSERKCRLMVDIRYANSYHVINNSIHRFFVNRCRF